MSSMHRTRLACYAAILALLPSPALAQDAAEWDRARAALLASPASDMQQAVARWKLLSSSDRFTFSEYAGFLMAYPDFPEAAKMRVSAEQALTRELQTPAGVVPFFDRFPPVTNAARAQHALALYRAGRPEARDMAKAAWRGGAMADPAEAAIFSWIAASLTPADHDARMDALLWAGSTAQAERQLLNVTPAARMRFAARLGMLNGTDPAALQLDPGTGAGTDPGWIHGRSRYLRSKGRSAEAVDLLGSRGAFAAPPFDTRKWLAEQLAAARAVDAAGAVRIATKVDDTFPAGTDISRQSFQIRDDYTSLVWLGGTRALNSLGDGARAATLFWRYGAAARTPQTRAKGFYWAGRAMTRAGSAAEATRYFEMAAIYPDQFYGMLALERLGRPLPPYKGAPKAIPTRAEREAFEARPLTAAVREVARGAEWQTTVRFFRQIADLAQSEADHVLVADLARELGRRDLAVILGQQAHVDGFGNFQTLSFPRIPVPQGSNWTFVHAIARQESQFSMNAVSHAGARGLMQLMPGTAREQAGKLYLAYEPQALMSDAGYNLTLGDAYFRRMLNNYGGSHPLAVAAYNAGPGNVNKWLRSIGDPRNGGIDWVEWIERIPLTETRGYVQHVLENAVVYEAMNPDKARYKGTDPLSHYLGKRTPG